MYYSPYMKHLLHFLVKQIDSSFQKNTTYISLSSKFKQLIYQCAEGHIEKPAKGVRQQYDTYLTPFIHRSFRQ